MSEDKLDEIPDHDLTPHENRRVRLIIRDNDYSKRFWANARLWISYAAGTTIFLLTFWDKIKGYVPTKFFPWSS